MEKIIKVNLMDITDTQNAIAEAHGDKCIIQSICDNIVDTRCINLLLSANYEISSDGRYLIFAKKQQQPNIEQIFNELLKYCNADFLCGIRNPNKGCISAEMIKIIAEKYGVKIQ